MAEKNTEIIIDKDKGLVFKSEIELYDFFADDIKALEKELFSLRTPKDIAEKEFIKYEKNLDMLIEYPDEVWEDLESTKQKNLAIFIKYLKEGDYYHIALAYLTDDIPSFVYLHFPTTDEGLVDKYRKGQLIYDRESDAILGAIEGDSLTEEDTLSRGLYEAMLKLRSDDDIKEEYFLDYAGFREESIEQADEIWRSNNSAGNVLVTFIKQFHLDDDEEVYYLSITQEDESSSTHALLFSFPTNDVNLVDRYRNGENLQADEITQESSH